MQLTTVKEPTPEELLEFEIWINQKVAAKAFRKFGIMVRLHL